jgi:hypothetical protein
MIITASQALRIVSSHAVIKAVPELLEAVEAHVEANRQYQPKKGCNGCNKSDFFSPVEKKALAAIDGLSSDAVDRLKKYLNVSKLYINPPESGKNSNLRELK